MILQITRKRCKHLVVQISRKEMINWHEMWQSLQRYNCIVWHWRFYPIRKTCKKWKLTLSSSMAMYSVMRDIHDARRVPMERVWVVLYLDVTCKYSNQLTLEQWAFENGLPVFGYTLYNNNSQFLYCAFPHKAQSVYSVLLPRSLDIFQCRTYSAQFTLPGEHSLPKAAYDTLS